MNWEAEGPFSLPLLPSSPGHRQLKSVHLSSALGSLGFTMPEEPNTFFVEGMSPPSCPARSPQPLDGRAPPPDPRNRRRQMASRIPTTMNCCSRSVQCKAPLSFPSPLDPTLELLSLPAASMLEVLHKKRLVLPAEIDYGCFCAAGGHHHVAGFGAPKRDGRLQGNLFPQNGILFLFKW